MSENYKLTQQDTIRHLLEWPTSRTLTTLDASADAKPWELSFSDGGNAEQSSLLEDSWAAPYKTKHTPAKKLAIVLLGIYPTELETYVYNNTSTTTTNSNKIHKCL